MKKILLSLFFLFSASCLDQLSAQEFVSGGENNFRWRLIGRVFFDGGVLNADPPRPVFRSTISGWEQ